jgi:hypothetical protein
VVIMLRCGLAVNGFERDGAEHPEAVPATRLYPASIHSENADASSSMVRQRRVSSSSRCIVDQSDSIMVLSTSW